MFNSIFFSLSRLFHAPENDKNKNSWISFYKNNYNKSNHPSYKNIYQTNLHCESFETKVIRLMEVPVSVYQNLLFWEQILLWLWLIILIALQHFVEIVSHLNRHSLLVVENGHHLIRKLLPNRNFFVFPPPRNGKCASKCASEAAERNHVYDNMGAAGDAERTSDGKNRLCSAKQGRNNKIWL